jgi:energy-coupling factor transport system permease protein
MHPVYLGISLISSLVYSIYLRGRKAARFSLLFMLPMMLLAAIVNPPSTTRRDNALLSTVRQSADAGEHRLRQRSSGDAASVVIWFTCYNEIMTSDKFVYLFGRVIPALSLVLSMTLRFVPKFSAQMKVVSEAQQCVGRDLSGEASTAR